MGKKLYVGNLPYNVNDEELKEMFAPFGDVASAQVISDKFSGRSKGFGFVEMSEDDAASKAKEEMNGKDIGGRPLKVDEAQERKPRTGGGGGGFRGDRGRGNSW